eukprot:3216044-Rhodomonas_salina.1
MLVDPAQIRIVGIDVSHQLHPGALLHGRPRPDPLGLGQEMPAVSFRCQESPCNSISDRQRLDQGSLQAESPAFQDARVGGSSDNLGIWLVRGAPGE